MGLEGRYLRTVIISQVHSKWRSGTYLVCLDGFTVLNRTLRSSESIITNGRSSISDTEPFDDLVVCCSGTNVFGIAKIDSEINIRVCFPGVMSEDEDSRQECG